MNWLDCQITGIADHVCSSGGAKYDINDLKAVSEAFDRGRRRVEQLIARRIAVEPLYWEDICDKEGA